MGESLTTFTRDDGVGTGIVLELAEAAGSIFISGPAGLEAFDGKKFIPVIPNDTESFRNLWGLLASRRSGLWFMEDRGIVHISKPNYARSRRAPNSGSPMNYSMHWMDFRPHCSAMAIDPDRSRDSNGRVWFATETDIVRIDPERVRHNRIAPGVVIQAISADGKTYRSVAGLKLPPRTTTAHFTFTATSFTIPDRVRFRIKWKTSTRAGRTLVREGKRRTPTWARGRTGFA